MSGANYYDIKKCGASKHTFFRVCEGAGLKHNERLINIVLAEIIKKGLIVWLKRKSIMAATDRRISQAEKDIE